MGQQPPTEWRRLTIDFAGWLDYERIPREKFFRVGLIVLDANVLLDLYRITPDARDQVLETLRSVVERLWVPYQAALEFSRNRKEVVKDRISSLQRTRRLLRAATADAVDALQSAVDQLINERERSGTAQEMACRRS